MRYLLDVNVLLALGLREHQFHSRAAAWLQAENSSALFTCSITELGFVRILAQTEAYGRTVEQAQELLRRLKSSDRYKFDFIPDDQDVSHLPAWVKSGKQTTDGHLAELARANGALLATFDGRIPRAHLIR